MRVMGLQKRHVAVYGPLQQDVEALQASFDKYLREKGLGVEAALAAYADESVPNLSSLVLLIGREDEAGHRRTLLLTGDARGDKIIEGLTRGGVMAEAPLHVNVLKVPHHGSENNVEPEFFRRILADTYVFSANGKYGNPDRSTLDWLIRARRKSDRYEIVLTYPIELIDEERQREHERKQESRARKNKPTVPWDNKNMSLERLFSDAEAEGYKFKLRVGDGKNPVTISI